MKKIVFGADIHLGQFTLSSEQDRIACKNSQLAISTKPKRQIVGVETFNETSWADHVVWGLPRNPQDTFYRFMDVFHSVKNIDRIPLNARDAKLALELAKRLHLDFPHAVTCAVAINNKADEIHTLYKPLLTSGVKKYMLQKHGIVISKPLVSAEQKFPESGLEKRYQDALKVFRREKIELLKDLHG